MSRRRSARSRRGGPGLFVSREQLPSCEQYSITRSIWIFHAGCRERHVMDSGQNRYTEMGHGSVRMRCAI